MNPQVDREAAKGLRSALQTAGTKLTRIRGPIRGANKVASADTPAKPQLIDNVESPTVKPTVSVIIPHYNDIENLRECLKRLRAQTMDQSQYEIVVSDNNSTCGLAAVVEACEGTARVVSAPKQGAAEARNVGVSAALGEVLAFIDSDCRPVPEW